MRRFCRSSTLTTCVSSSPGQPRDDAHGEIAVRREGEERVGEEVRISRDHDAAARAVLASREPRGIAFATARTNGPRRSRPGLNSVDVLSRSTRSKVVSPVDTSGFGVPTSVLMIDSGTALPNSVRCSKPRVTGCS